MIFANGKVIQERFPDGTLHLNINDCNFDIKKVFIHWSYKSDDELFTLICLKGYLDYNYPNLPVILSVPYLPHARMDRVKDKKDVFTLKYFCQTINSLNFDKVIIWDCHSNVGTALLNRVENKSPKKFIARAIARSGAEVLFFPDEGAMKRYSSLIYMPYAFGNKERDWKTGAINKLSIVNGELVKDKNVLIVDDICSRGGTFVRAANLLKAAGARKISLYVTHCEETIEKGEVLDMVDKVYTAHSLEANYKSDKIERV